MTLTITQDQEITDTKRRIISWVHRRVNLALQPALTASSQARKAGDATRMYHELAGYIERLEQIARH